jgi:uncharacterized cysteine cluster protein YcgN (CxxCxxCC family)
MKNVSKQLKDIDPGSPEWEAICERCGRCCYEKYEYKNKILYTKTPCRFLDIESKTCTIYSERSVRHPECVSLTPEIVRAGILPADCPYVRDLEGYEPPIIG